MRVVEKMPERAYRHHASQFEQLFDGQIWEVTLADFPTYKSINSLNAGIRSTAYTRKLKVTIRQRKDYLYVQVLGKIRR